MRAVRVAESEDGEAWALAVSERAFEGGQLLKKDGGAEVWRAMMLGRDVVVKRVPVRGWWGVLKARAGWSRAARQWRGAERLARGGFRTARCLVLLRGEETPRSGVEPRRGAEWLVMEWVPGETLLRYLADAWEREKERRGEGWNQMQEREKERCAAAGTLGRERRGEAWNQVRKEQELAREVGRMAARMCKRGCWNRDHKPSNLIVVSVEPVEVAVVDGVAIGGRATEEGLARMLFSLVIEAEGCGVRPRRAVLMRGLRAAVEEWGGGDERAWWRRVEGMVRGHGDARPRVDPLG